jgi:hypothetical protein
MTHDPYQTAAAHSDGLQVLDCYGNLLPLGAATGQALSTCVKDFDSNMSPRRAALRNGNAASLENAAIGSIMCLFSISL